MDIKAGTPLTRDNKEAMTKWCEDHGLQASATYRVVINEKTMMATIYQYRLVDRQTVKADKQGKPMKKQPFQMPIKSLPVHIQ